MKLMDFMESMLHDYESASTTLRDELYNLNMLQVSKIKLAECEAKLQTLPDRLSRAQSDLSEAKYDIDYFCDYRHARNLAYERKQSAEIEIHTIEVERYSLLCEIEELKKQISELEEKIKDFSEKLIACNKEILKNIDLYATESKTQELIKPRKKTSEKKGKNTEPNADESSQTSKSSGQPGEE